MVNIKQDQDHSSSLSWEQLQQYDKPLPRYTSYPTAPVWSDMDQTQAIKALEQLKSSNNPISIYVHFPFCQNMCLYCGCNVIVSKSPKQMLSYLDAVVKEIEMISKLIGSKRLVQLHYGGGTPTTSTPKELARITESLFKHFTPTDNSELSIEIDPVVTTSEHLQMMRSLGFNRLSMGVQDFDDEVQRVVNRNQSAETSKNSFELARNLGFSSINIDLIYGLPLQTPAHLEQSAARVVELGADRVAVFGYAHVPWMKPHQKQLEPHGIPTAEQRFQMFEAARNVFLDSGYKPIGLDHFALPNDELALAANDHRLKRNFQGYTVLDTPDVIGIGLTSIGDVAGAYLQNAKRLSDYFADIEQEKFATRRGMIRSVDDDLRRAVITSIMCNLFVDFKTIENGFNIEFKKYFQQALQALAPFETDGLLIRHDNAIEILERGRIVIRNIAAVFDVYLNQDKTDQPRFSRSI